MKVHIVLAFIAIMGVSAHPGVSTEAINTCNSFKAVCAKQAWLRPARLLRSCQPKRTCRRYCRPWWCRIRIRSLCRSSCHLGYKHPYGTPWYRQERIAKSVCRRFGPRNHKCRKCRKCRRQARATASNSHQCPCTRKCATAFMSKQCRMARFKIRSGYLFFKRPCYNFLQCSRNINRAVRRNARKQWRYFKW